MVGGSNPGGKPPAPDDPSNPDGKPPDGKPPAPDDPDRSYILSKISDCRKTCEWIAGLGIAYVLSAVIRAPDLSPDLRHSVITLAFAQILIAIIGAWPVTTETNVALVDAVLLKRFGKRRIARFVSMLLLLAG